MRLLRWLIGTAILAVLAYADLIWFSGPWVVKGIHVILFCTLFVLYRVVVGPTPADRIVAVDIMGILIIGLLALLGLHYRSHFFMDVALIWALLSFIASLAFAKILEGRSLDD